MRKLPHLTIEDDLLDCSVLCHFRKYLAWLAHGSFSSERIDFSSHFPQLDEITANLCSCCFYLKGKSIARHLILQLFAHFKNEKLSDYTCIQKHVIAHWSYSYLILDPLTCEVRSLTPFSVILSKPCTNHSNHAEKLTYNCPVNNTMMHEKNYLTCH